MRYTAVQGVILFGVRSEKAVRTLYYLRFQRISNANLTGSKDASGNVSLASILCDIDKYWIRGF